MHFRTRLAAARKCLRLFAETFLNDHRDRLTFCFWLRASAFISRLRRRDPTKVQGLLLGIN